MQQWDVDSEIIEDWGRLQIVINGQDLTFYRGVPTIVDGWSDAEPFSDAVASITFPGITAFESLDDLPFSKFDNIEIQHVHPVTNEVVKNVFEGMVVSFDDSLDEGDNGLQVECIGALYQADFFIKPTIFNDYTFDLANAIKREFDLRISEYGLRLKPMVEHTYCNIGSRNRGSFNPLLTGWVQELLGKAYTQAFLIDSESAAALVYNPSEDPVGYMIVGSYGSFLSFGDDFPNYGSWSYLILFLILYKNKPKLAISDASMLPDGSGVYSVSKEGQVAFFSEDSFGNPKKTLGDVKGSRYTIWAINVTPSGDGYWLCDSRGKVYCFGDAQHYGDLPDVPMWFSVNDFIVDMSPTPSGEGYYLISKYGKVFPYGDATDWGYYFRDVGIDDFVTHVVAIQAFGSGYYALTNNGEIWNFFAPELPFHGDARSSGARDFVDLVVNSDASGYALLQSDGYVYTYGDFEDFGHARWSDDGEAGANIYQWTLLKHPGRQLEMRIKNQWTTHWTVGVGTPGVSHQLTRDFTQIPNVYYGEGVNQENCRWRNTIYPNIHPDDAPRWPGYSFSTSRNAGTSAVRIWEQGMVDRGWNIAVDGRYTEADRRACMQLQAKSGILKDGIVGAQTWTATFQVGQDSGDASGAYYAPIAQLPELEPFTYSASGAVSGRNPLFDKTAVRVETFENFGEGTSKQDAEISTRARLKKSALNPGYYGTITLKSDPEEGSRFDIRAGQNILYRNYRGTDTRFHISAVSVDLGSMTTSLTVDTEARDAMTIANLMERNRETNEPGGVRTRRASQGQTTEDRIAVWDCENGAGVIPKHGITAGLWNVLKIPVGEFGEIVQTDIRTAVPARISAAVFDRPITANELSARGWPDDENFWKDFPEGRGLIISWGGAGNMGGYYPGRESDEDPLTGVLIDRASWVYWTSEAPWVWVALWSNMTTYIEGRLYPGMEGVGLVPDVTALPG